MKVNRLLAGTLAIVLIAGLGTPAYAQVSGAISSPQNNVATPAGPITQSSTWYEFIHEAVGGPTTGCFPTDPVATFGCITSGGGNSQELDTPPWTFTCGSGGCWVTVADAFGPIEDFELFDNLVSQGVTSAPGGPGAGDPTDPANTSIDGAWSTGMFFLGPGPHSITIIQTTGGLGAAYFQLTEHTPVGGTLIPIDSTALVLAAAQSPSVLLSALTIAALGIGAFVFTRNENNMRNIKVILRDYLDRF